MGKEKVIIITNASQFEDVSSSATFNGFENLQSSGFMIFADKELVITSNLNNVDIIFVWDRNKRGVIDNPEWWINNFLPMKNENEKWYVLHHSKGLNSEHIRPSSSIICREGEHKASNFVYREVVKILLDDSDKKKERIIKSVFSFEPILEFLHGCLEHEPKEADYQKLRDVGVETSSLLELIGKPFEDEYIASLTLLRDELLK